MKVVILSREEFDACKQELRKKYPRCHHATGNAVQVHYLTGEHSWGYSDLGWYKQHPSSYPAPTLGEKYL